MDDGIELNIASPSSGLGGALRRQLLSKKGGRWTERVKARKAVRYTARQLTQAGDASNAPDIVPTESRGADQARSAEPSSSSTHPPASKPRQSLDERIHQDSNTRLGQSSSQPSTQTASRSTTQTINLDPIPRPSRKHASQPSQPSQPKLSRPPQIVSSLFTSNPLPSQSVNTPSVQTPGAPSNAPLIGDTSTFEGLGLDLILRRQLRKMKVERPTGVQQSALPYMLSSSLDIDQKLGEDEEKPVAPLRDVIIQSQTGSGKTLAYLLPVIQTLLPLSRLSYIDRSIGTLAIILAPTRELAQQISKALEHILSMSLSSDEDNHMTRWLVPGLLTGGSTKTHEKARLRKGIPILASTPGRLLDHLQNTASFKCAKTMFLVLDEADRLMDLGFEETITGIIKALNGRRKNEIAHEKEMDEEGGGTMRWPFWARGRQTILCSATMDAKVERLSGVALREPMVFRSTDQARTKEIGKKIDVEATLRDSNAVILPQVSIDKFTPPSQLAQKYIITPTKLRLVTLVALLRSLVATGQGTKIIVFLSSTDAVDFHWTILGNVQMGQEKPGGTTNHDVGADNGDVNEAKHGGTWKSSVKTAPTESTSADSISLTSPLFPSATINRLHGSLPLRTRQASLAAFSAPSSNPSILLATSVASRGLDLPLVRAVVQYDLPTEGGANEYVHRVGRTARAGKGGEAWALVTPNEADWVAWVGEKMGAVEEQGMRLTQVGVEDVLKKGFGGKGYEYEGRATDVQLALERWVLVADENASLARKAFGSFVRAYSTHPLEEKKFFHSKSLHLGHLAKSFALREAPRYFSTFSKPAPDNPNPPLKRRREDKDDGRLGKESGARNETERRMYAAVRTTGRATKSGGAMGEFNKARRGDAVAESRGGEFQVVGSAELEKMVRGPQGTAEI